MKKASAEIVVVDDDPIALQMIKIVLSDLYGVHCFTEPRDAEIFLHRHDTDLVILDINLSGSSGLDVLNDWREKFVDLEILFCSGETKVERAIECLRQGASDYVVKPFKKDDFLLIVRRALEKSELKKRVDTLKPMVLPHPVEFVGESSAIQEVLDKISQLKNQTHLNILLLGESGTGKELVARLLHQQEEDHKRPFVVVNTPAIPATLMEAELFGVIKGAYTDAKTSRAGKFELADGGDIFLDEIGDLPPDTQAKMLRTLQERQVERIGSSKSRYITFRSISATNQSIAELIKKGKFREDLLYRLSDVVLWLPPLTERRKDIPALTHYFIRKYSFNKSLPKISENALSALVSYDWPGNIRQLESTIKRTLVFNQEEEIEDIEILDPTTLHPRRSHSPLEEESAFEVQLYEFQKKIISSTLRKYNGNRSLARRKLQLSRATFYRKLSQFDIPTH